MKYFSKILLTLFILMFVCLSVCTISYAENTAPSAETTQTESTGQITTTVKSTSSTENELFSVTNIINILLIAVGIVLILLAIAIFTRLKG